MIILSEPKNVQIPYELFKSLLDLLEYVDIENYSEDYQSAFMGILEALKDKQRRIAIREDYGRLVVANKIGDEDKKFDARMNYLRNRNTLS